MTGDRDIGATRGLNDTQLMLARHAGDERGGGAIASPGRRRASAELLGPPLGRQTSRASEFVVRSAMWRLAPWVTLGPQPMFAARPLHSQKRTCQARLVMSQKGRYCRKSHRKINVEFDFETNESRE